MNESLFQLLAQTSDISIQAEVKRGLLEDLTIMFTPKDPVLADHWVKMTWRY